MKSVSFSLRIFAASISLLAAASTPALAQTNYYAANGTEYTVVGSLPGDQMFPDVALSTNGGFVVWQDAFTDGSGWGVSARRLDSTLSGTLSAFRVNTIGADDQENARVTMLKTGGAAFFWQGGREGYQHIYGRFMKANNTWVSAADVLVSTFASTNSFQIAPSAATLNNGNVVVVWASFNQVSTNSQLDVYAKILSPTGGTVKGEFLVNQFTSWNQRTPTVAALNNGGFVVAWVSEQQRGAVPVPSVDVYARQFQASGIATGNEFLVSTSNFPSANPAVAASTDGSFLIAWSGRDVVTISNTWDVYARAFSAGGTGSGTFLVNQYLHQSQYAPRLAAIGSDYMLAWTSVGQDGSREGVYGRFVHANGNPVGNEFRINTTTISQQMQPVVASDGSSQFLAVWTSYVGSPGFDLYAQRYLNVESLLQPMPAPFVSAPFTLNNNVYQPQLQVSWAPLAGISVSNYQVYVDGTTLMSTKSNLWVMTAAAGLTTNDTHSFQVRYVKNNGAVSPWSVAASGTTWSGVNWNGVPFEWMAQFYGKDTSSWPSASAPMGGNGKQTLAKIFASGGNPLDPSTWLTTQLVRTQQGVFLAWNTQPGFVYQVQYSSDLINWTNVGQPRFAAGNSDSVNVGGSGAGYYQVVLLR